MRGSTPAPGKAFVRYGGHTSSVALTSGDGQPDLLLDAGTGIRELDGIASRPFRGHLVLSHLHWDHVQGLPFSEALVQRCGRLQVLIPTAPGTTAVEALLPGFSPPSFPVPVTDVCPAWEFAPLSTEMTLGAWEVRTSAVHHKGGHTVGIRVERGGRSLVYIPDHDLAEHDPLAVRLAHSADVLFHDAQYRAHELDRYRDYGHSTVEAAIDFALRTEVRHLVLIHHAPFRTDQALDDIAAEFEGDHDGLLVTVGAQNGLIPV